jgi:hypothetical protein
MKRAVWIVGVVMMCLGALWTFRVFSTWRVNARTEKFREDVENLFVGLQQYKENVGAYPVGSNADVAKALMGKNPKNVIILVGRKNEMNAKGEFIDPWGTALRIYFSDNGVLVRSAGPNRRFDDSTSIDCDDFFRSN